jgi:formamidopyrimidine-DNA glycosylase
MAIVYNAKAGSGTGNLAGSVAAWQNPAMPELPEVEVTRRRIAGKLVGRTIARVYTTAASYFFLSPPAQLKRRLKDREVTALARLGKYLVADLDDGSRMLLHLGMTGQLFVQGSSSPRLLSRTARASLTPEHQLAFKPDRHTHLRIAFADGGPEVWFRDARKFGKVKWIAPGKDDARLAKLGVDALAATGADLRASASRRKASIKAVLLDQSVLAGVGNIYADEALFGAGIRPKRSADKLTRNECDKLVAAVKRVLQRSIETGGSSISDYIGPDGEDGAYQDERMVYARAGEPCKVCRTPIKRLIIGARSSHYCSRCQK